MLNELAFISDTPAAHAPFGRADSVGFLNPSYPAKRFDSIFSLAAARRAHDE